MAEKEETMNRRYGSIRKYILISMIIVPFVPFVLILGVGFYHFKDSIETGTISHIKRIAEDHSQMIEVFLAERKSDLEFIAGSYVFQDLNAPEKIRTVFDRLKKESDAFVDLGIFNADGIHTAYHGPYRLTGMVYKNTPWFREVMKQGYYISDVFLGYRKIPHFIIAIAKEDQNGKWVIRATIDTLTFCRLVNEVRIGKTGEAYILNKEGIFQTQRRSGGTLMGKSMENTDRFMSDSGIHTFISNDEEGNEYLYATALIKDNSWFLIVRQEASDAFQTLRTTVNLTILIMVLGGAIIITTAFYLTDRIVMRMKKIDAEKEQLSNQLIGASRLAELGEMAAGFAHEINNPLQIIKSEQAFIDTLIEELMDGGELKPSESLAELEDSIKQISLQVSRCSKITQAILKFGRQGDSIDQDVDLRVFLLEIIAMVEKKAAVHGISILQNLDGQNKKVYGDPARLQQVFVNLFNNAMDAIIEEHGNSDGELMVKLHSQDNGFIEIQVKDNGSGIRPENMGKIFAPFFTTKPVGKGTGLGLSVCYGIIENMGGVMEVSSEQGVGTTFFIRLPVKV